MKHLLFGVLSILAICSNRGADAEAPPKKTIEHTFATEDQKYRFRIDATAAPDLLEWGQQQLAPVIVKWYPRLVEMLPSEGYTAPTNVNLRFREDMGGTPASAGGGNVNLNAPWFRKNLGGEARGAVVHELIHVIQNYGQARRNNPDAKRTPGWLVEGIPDYIRWFLYEPETHGADLTTRNLARAKYDASYRITGNFLDWVTRKHDPKLVQKINAAARQGKYDGEIWKTATGKTVQELGQEWLRENEARLGFTRDSSGQLWRNLFNGKNLDGWHNFGGKGVRPGWRVEEGVLVCADPHNAGDICTTDKFDWFELELDFKMSPGGNSGVMFHVTDEAGSPWATGPEVQLEDNKEAQDPQRCGWLYALYQPARDEKTGKPIDATKPAGEWNTLRLVISPEKCEHFINGVKYLEYVLGSDDFKERVAKSKFGSMPHFAKSDNGYIALQGDHGQVAFRNIRLRALPAKKG